MYSKCKHVQSASDGKVQYQESLIVDGTFGVCFWLQYKLYRQFHTELYIVSEFLVGTSANFQQNIWLWLKKKLYLFIALDVEWSIYGYLYNWADEMSNLNVFGWLEWISVCSYRFLTIYITLHCLDLCSFICLLIFAISMVLFAFFVSTSSWFWLIYRITKCVTIWETITYTKTTNTRSLAHSRAWHLDILCIQTHTHTHTHTQARADNHTST